jgi:putative endopeptidase
MNNLTKQKITKKNKVNRFSLVKNKINKKNTRKNIKEVSYNNLKNNNLTIFENVSNIKKNYKDYEDYEKKYLYSKQTLVDKKKSNDRINNEVVKNLNRLNKQNILPNNDYYNYVNDLWLKNYKLDGLQKYVVQANQSVLDQDIVYYELKDIIEEEIKKKTKFSESLRDFYDSTIKYTPLETSKQIITNIISVIDEMRQNRDNLWKMLAYVNKLDIVGCNAPFYFKIDIIESTLDYNCCMYPCPLELLDTNVYIDNGTDIEYKEKYRNTFYNFQKKCYKLLLGDHYTLNEHDVFEVQQKLFNSFINNDPNNVKENTFIYNKNLIFATKITSKEALEKYNFHWEIFCKELGMKKIPEKFYVTSCSYFVSCTDLLINEWHTEKWRAYWIWIFLRTITRFTDSDGAEIYYEFNGNFMRGQDKMLPIVPRSSSLISVAFNNFLSLKYYEKYYDKNYIDYANIISKKILDILVQIIDRNKWISEISQQKIIEKLKNTIFKIGFSPKQMNLIEDPILDYDSSNLIKNLWLYYDKRLIQEFEMINKPYQDISIGNTSWNDYPTTLIGNQTYMVNAYYVPVTNTIVIPLGYLQKPFIDLDDRGKEYNLSQIGFTIAHELSHSLNEYSLNFDKLGNLQEQPLLSKTDYFKYKKIIDNIDKQFFLAYKKDKLNFKFSNLDESFADISAVQICLDFLRDYHNMLNLSPIERSLSFEIFFVYYAIRTRTKVNKESLESELRRNPHPLAKYRCNIPLTRSKIFRTIYNVQKNDGMWWENEDSIW